MADQTQTYNSPDFRIKLPDSVRLGETIPVKVGEMAPEFEAQSLDLLNGQKTSIGRQCCLCAIGEKSPSSFEVLISSWS